MAVDKGAKAAPEAPKATPAATADKQPATTKASLERQRAAQECTVFVYLGPSLPGGALNKNAVLQGTLEQVRKHLAPQIEEYPQVQNLLVPAQTLGASKARVAASGNYLHKCYKDVQGAADHKRQSREG